MQHVHVPVCITAVMNVHAMVREVHVYVHVQGTDMLRKT